MEENKKSLMQVNKSGEAKIILIQLRAMDFRSQRCISSFPFNFQLELKASILALQRLITLALRRELCLHITEYRREFCRCFSFVQICLATCEIDSPHDRQRPSAFTVW
eukprot:GEMP01099277.1.p3 GENE.GEMP01099277.1~~GEMP01099277.1.p3  ORF type:complete len:108 (-),score=17.76 GEMP01099277.1:220-543(-)